MPVTHNVAFIASHAPRAGTANRNHGDMGSRFNSSMILWNRSVPPELMEESVRVSGVGFRAPWTSAPSLLLLAFIASSAAFSFRRCAPLLSSIRTIGSCPAAAAMIRGLGATSSGASRFAWAFSNSLAVDSWPLLHAAMRGVSPTLSGWST
eukprot:scaffold96304_cov32-Tisochrysis_lutea.AAC.4